MNTVRWYFSKAPYLIGFSGLIASAIVIKLGWPLPWHWSGLVCIPGMWAGASLGKLIVEQMKRESSDTKQVLIVFGLASIGSILPKAFQLVVVLWFCFSVIPAMNTTKCDKYVETVGLDVDVLSLTIVFAMCIVAVFWIAFVVTKMYFFS